MLPDYLHVQRTRSCTVVLCGLLTFIAGTRSAFADSTTTLSATGPKSDNGMDAAVVTAFVQNGTFPVTNADIQIEVLLSTFYGQLSQYSVRLDSLNVNNGSYRSSFVSPVPGVFSIYGTDRVGLSSDQATTTFTDPLLLPAIAPLAPGPQPFAFSDDVKTFFMQLDFEFYPPMLLARIADPATPAATRDELKQRLMDLGQAFPVILGDVQLETLKAAGRNTAAMQAAFQAAETAAKNAIQRLSTKQIQLFQQTFGNPVDYDKFQAATELFNNFDLAGDVNDAIDRIDKAKMLLKALKDARGTPGEAAAKKAVDDFVKDGVVVRGPDGAAAHIRWVKFANIALDLGIDSGFWSNVKPLLAKGSAITVSVLDKDKKKKLTADEIKTIRDMYDPLRPKPGDTDDDKKKKLQQLEQKIQDLLKTIYIDKKTVAQLPGFDSGQTIQVTLGSSACSGGSESSLPMQLSGAFSLTQASDGSVFGFGADNAGLTYLTLGTSDGTNVTFLVGGPGFSPAQGLSLAVFSGTAFGGGIISGTVDGITSGLVAGNPDNCNWSGSFVVKPRQLCDVNGDGKVDRNDLATIFAAHNTPSTSGDPRDADGDSVITVNDVRFCTLRCTKVGCVP